MGLFGWGRKKDQEAPRPAGQGAGPSAEDTQEVPEPRDPSAPEVAPAPAAAREDGTPMDDALPFFTAEQADRFRALALRILDEMGLAPTIEGDRVRVADGSEYGFWNMAAQCHDYGDGREEDWPAIVRAHFDAMRSAESHEDIDTMTDAELLSGMKWRLNQAESATPVVSLADPGTTEFAPGILKHLVVDLPQTVMTVAADKLAGRIGLEDLSRAADVNTRAVWERGDFEVQQLGELPVQVVLGESFFTSTMAIYLPDVARQVCPGVHHSFGIVFAMPYRHMLVVHVPQDAATTQELVPPLLEFVKRTYAEAPGGVSPELYYYDDGEVVPFTHTTEGHVRVEVRGALADLFTIQGQAGDAESGPGEG